ncbi:phasin family protein [Microvirga sp. 2YAF29]|uniref:phasin family protein n=1 Tax=Microvirga sp. 2YAF29 TaxID=3233031 RepID=UPI003F9480FA
MAEVKKTRTRSPKSAPKADLVELAAAPVAENVEVIEATPVAPTATLPAPVIVETVKKAEEAFSTVRSQGDAFRHAMRESATVSAKGALEVNGKIIEALHSQGHAAIELWRTALDNKDLQTALKTQTQAARDVFETASAQWKDIAETTAHWMTKSFEPLRSALHRPR